jgi:hypothetical protein
MLGSETKKIRSETKLKQAVLILLWLEAKNSERKERKRKSFSRERAKRISFRFFCETGAT